MDNLDLYAILGVTKNSTDAEIKKVKSKSSWTTVEKKNCINENFFSNTGRKKMQKKIGQIILGRWGKSVCEKKKLQIFNVKVE